MMRYTSSCRYLSGDVFDMICRSYSNGAYRFSLLLPKDGYGVEDVAEALKENGFQKYMNAAKSEYVKLYMPRFETEYSVNLSETLMAMGMKSAFTANADFSGITTADELFVDKVLHKASI
jgi:serpin B